MDEIPYESFRDTPVEKLTAEVQEYFAFQLGHTDDRPQAIAM